MGDPIPAGTTFVPGSITLKEGTAAVGTLTDADDTDEGDFDETTSAAVTVAIDGTRNGDSGDDVITLRVTIDEAP